LINSITEIQQTVFYTEYLPPNKTITNLEFYPYYCAVHAKFIGCQCHISYWWSL